MSVDDAFKRAVRLRELERMLLSEPEKSWRTREIGERLGISEDTALRDLVDSSRNGWLPLYAEGAGPSSAWRLSPEARSKLPPLRLTYAQGAALYAAARLLNQQQDERNESAHVMLTDLIAVLPPPLQPQLAAIVTGLRHAASRGDVSAIFDVLAQGWLTRRVVSLTYEPPRAKPFTCQFSPYLLEPSNIGRTIYFIGHSNPPDARRTYKLERVRQATLTDDSFSIPADFDGVELLRRAWGVMSGGDEPAHVTLRFSQFVSQRVRETIWHPSQQLTATPDGLIWEAEIGDVTEIRPWIRGWGADCEVIAPAELRQEMLREAQRLARLYGIRSSAPAEGDEPDPAFLRDLFGKE